MKPQMIKVGLDQPILHKALSLASIKDGVCFPGGVGTIVGPNLLIRSRHVVETDWRRFESSKLEGSAVGSFSMHALQMTEGKVSVWQVRTVFASRLTDIAFMYVTPYHDVPDHYAWEQQF